MIDLRHAFEALRPLLNEKTRRLIAASLVLNGDHGLRSYVSKETGVSFQAIRRGLDELKAGDGDLQGQSDKIRQKGGERKKITEVNPSLLATLKDLVESSTRGDPESPLLWTSKSVRRLAKELNNNGYSISFKTVSTLLSELGYSLQANRKTEEGTNHPDRNEQFNFINDKMKCFLSLGQPVISVDCKKHELIGNFKNNGKEYMPKGEPVKVKDHDFMDKELGKVIPFGVLDIKNNQGYVNVGVDHDTSVFAVETIRQWWNTMGFRAFSNATKLLIVADGGGSNGYRRKLWKLELSKLAKEHNLDISVCHYPTGTSKWNKIEHRLFSYISMNWRGRPLISHEVVINLISSTTTEGGLTVNCDLDKGEYPTGIKVSDVELAKIKISHDSFHGEWNYTISP